MKKSYELYKKFGVHKANFHGKDGFQFTVYSPYASQISVIGNFNEWNPHKNLMNTTSKHGVWSLFIPDLNEGDIYKFHIKSKNGNTYIKSDPFAFFSELRPDTASIIYDPFKDFNWEDEVWMKNKKNYSHLNKPFSVYEIHLGSWKQNHNYKEYSNGCEFLNYREIADLLVPYLIETGFTHVEVMPICEHPLDASWGYQTTGYFSVTSRYGSPEDFKYFVNKCHVAGIGVILDWVPAHFCKDDHGLYTFDGSHLYEYFHEYLRENYTWGTANFDLTKPFVKNFLISSVHFFFEYFHIDGLRIDAVSYMLYLEHGKEKVGLKNHLGGDGKLEAIDFFREFNTVLHEKFDNPIIIAEESSDWPLVTRPPEVGGLGFNYKWNMGWMNDMLRYMSLDFQSKIHNHNLLTFSIMYSFSENYILSLSHDEVVHGKKSLLDKMYGTYNQKFDSLRMFYTFMFAHPGKKHLFMGGEIAQFIEWKFYEELEWNLLEFPLHKAMKTFVSDLNFLYRKEKPLWELDTSHDGFNWINLLNHNHNIITFTRHGNDPNDFLLIICNFTPNLYLNHHIGVPRMTDYIEILNSDQSIYGGSNCINPDTIKPINRELDNQPFSIAINLAPLSTIILKPTFFKKEAIK